MQTTLGILTALVLVASAFLGYKNKEKYELQISTRQKEEDLRDNEVIGKLLVKSVEANTAAAEIVPNSIKADTVLMVGDSVRSTMPPPPPPPKKEATAPAGAPNAAPATPAAEVDPLTGAPVIPPGGALVAPAAPADADFPAAPADAATPKPAEDDPFK